MKNILFRKVELWFVALLLLLFAIGLLGFGWLVQHRARGGAVGGKLAEACLKIAELPEPLHLIYKEGLTRAVMPGVAHAPDGIVHHTVHQPELPETGALLISAFDPEPAITTPYVFDLASQKVLKRWEIPYDAIIEAIRTSGEEPKGEVIAQRDFRTAHPLPLPDGGLVFSSGEGPLVRIDRDGKLVWVINRHFHHTIEMTPDGTLLVPIVLETDKNYIQPKTGKVPLRDDGVAEISLDGTILREVSATQILSDHGALALLACVGPWEWDRIHLNDAQPMMESDGFVEKGDWALSLRNISTVLLYRPSEHRVIWLQTGPWINQHDVDYQGDGVFTIFGNDILRTTDRKTVPFTGANRIYRYDAKSGEASILHDLATPGIYTVFEGLHTLRADGDLIVEESHKKLLHRIRDGKLVWTYAHHIDDTHRGTLQWCRYYEHPESLYSWILPEPSHDQP